MIAPGSEFLGGTGLEAKVLMDRLAEGFQGLEVRRSLHGMNAHTIGHTTVRLTPEESGLMQRLTRRPRLDRGEAESIALASVRGLRLIVDDKEARGVAAAAGVEYWGTVGALLEAHLRQHLDLGELEATLRDLTQTLWLSPAVVAEALRLAREASR